MVSREGFNYILDYFMNSKDITTLYFIYVSIIYNDTNMEYIFM